MNIFYMYLYYPHQLQPLPCSVFHLPLAGGVILGVLLLLTDLEKCTQKCLHTILTDSSVFKYTRMHTHSHVNYSYIRVHTAGMYLCMCVYTHTHTHTHPQAYIYIHLNTHTHTHTHTHTTNTNTHTHTHVPAGNQADSRAHPPTHRHTHTHINTHTETTSTWKLIYSDAPDIVGGGNQGFSSSVFCVHT
jgi:hypothetical protein